MAGSYKCRNIDLLSFLPLTALDHRKRELGEPPAAISDLWGWTDSVTGHEFALIARVDGTSFVDVTDPINPQYVGDLPRPPNTFQTYWRDIKVYRNYAFVVADASSPHGMQVFDLTQLRQAQGTSLTFQESAHYNGFLAAHNLAINAETGYAYAIISSGGSLTCEGGLHMIDIRDPVKPVYAGCYADGATVGIHDAQCVVYHGPDQQYRGREICFNAAGNAVSIADVTDKQQPKTISVATYPKVGYALQGWLSEDQRYFFLTDHPDASAGATPPSRMIVFDVSRLSKPAPVKDLLGAPAAVDRGLTDHNLYARGHYVYQANSKAGMRVLDVRRPTQPREVGAFDITPPPAPDQSPNPGAWTAYPFFKSGALGITSVSEGLLLVRFTPPTP